MVLWVDAPADGDVRLRLEYDTERHDAPQAEAWLDLVVGRLRDVEAAPPELFASTMRAPADAPSDEGAAAHVHRRLLAQARARPAHAALLHGDARLTYAALATRATRLAAGLRGTGWAAPERIVPLLLPRSTELVAAMYGVLLAGAAYVVLDPRQGDDHLRYVFDDLGCERAVGERDGARTVALGALDAPPSDAAPDGQANALMYVMYTSGTTGRPKGVMVQHGGFANLMRCFAPERDRVCGVLFNPVFDGFPWRVYATLGEMGGTCALLDQLDVGACRASLTSLEGVPSTVAALERAPPSAPSSSAARPSPTACCAPRARAACARDTNYGPTEVTVRSHGHVVTPASSRMSIGVEAPACTAPWSTGAAPAPRRRRGRALDRRRAGGARLLAPARADRRAIRDASRRPALPQRRPRRAHAPGRPRVPRPPRRPGEAARPARRARRRRERQGRAARRARGGGGRPSRPPRRLRRAARRRRRRGDRRARRLPTLRAVGLPAFMRPSWVVGVDAWPRTASGKIDRRRLPPPALVSAADAAPTCPRLRELRDLAADVLGVAAAGVSLDQPWAHLGGHSIAALGCSPAASRSAGASPRATCSTRRPYATSASARRTTRHASRPSPRTPAAPSRSRPASCRCSR